MSGLIFIGFIIAMGLTAIGLYVIAKIAQKYVDNFDINNK